MARTKVPVPFPSHHEPRKRRAERVLAAEIPAAPEVVHEGRGGYVEIAGARYAIEHVEGGRFAIHFPSGHRHAGREADRRALEALVASEPTKWSLEARTVKPRPR